MRLFMIAAGLILFIYGCFASKESPVFATTTEELGQGLGTLETAVQELENRLELRLESTIEELKRAHQSELLVMADAIAALQESVASLTDRLSADRSSADIARHPLSSAGGSRGLLQDETLKPTSVTRVDNFGVEACFVNVTCDLHIGGTLWWRGREWSPNDPTPAPSLAPTLPPTTLPTTKPTLMPSDFVECSREACDTTFSAWTISPPSTTVCHESDASPLPGCSASKTWDEARAICQGVGARLMTALEIDSGVATGTGCSYNIAQIWSSTSCGDGSYYKHMGDGSGSSSCVAASSTAAVRCGADVAGSC